ncbi:MAG: hypothetical protein VZT48_07495 [Bulleidia sp.]|nr:hypothetical protein [Bulleidia sp.]
MDTEAWFVMDGYTVILDLILLILTASGIRNASSIKQGAPQLDEVRPK